MARHLNRSKFCGNGLNYNPIYDSPLKFIVQLHDGEDGRTKSITMTDYGKEQLALYAKELYSVMAIQP